MQAYKDLMAYERDTQALSQIAGRLGWDQETMMPEGASPQRGEEMGAIEAVLHERRTAACLGEWLSALEDAPLDDIAQAQIREIHRAYTRASKVPADLARRIAQVTSTAQGKWAEARAADDFAAFAPVLTEVLELKREEGRALAEGGDVYDAMLQDYEPGTTAAEIAQLFDQMRATLVDLRAAVLDQPLPQGLTISFDETRQLALSQTLARAFGYDLSHGRIDKAVHPFSSGSGLDVRITTRTAPNDPFNCFYSTIHEVGHAAYEQGVDPAYLLTPLGRGASMGVHESQSRIYENQLGRSRPFTGWLYEQMRTTFGDFGIPDAAAFYKTVNTVKKGYIRTEADELQYNLHIMLRFDLERALVEDDLQVADLETAWNDRFAADFGYGIDKASNGVLQDVHWSVGLFGYFPTYSLGNIYAGCLNEAMRADLPDLDMRLAVGDTTPATTWLRERLQQYGSRFTPKETITRACGGVSPTADHLLAYLHTKFTDLYGLA